MDAAIFLSGYRIRIGSNTDPANTGRLHVDFAQVCATLTRINRDQFLKMIF